MHFLLGLDYELFLGPRSGSVERCLLEPTEAIAKVLVQHGFRFTLFVDAAYLLHLQHYTGQYDCCAAALADIEQQLRRLVKNGHDVQLHLHPHWQDCTFDGNQWQARTERYRLHDFNDEDIRGIVRTGKTMLANIAGCDIIAFRAGGWCLQPFAPIAPALREAGIWLDSTVFAGGQSTDTKRWYDFTSAPDRSCWRFADDPARADESGDFVEVPISAHRLSPSFFWGMALRKKLGGAKHKAYGDGSVMQADSGYYWERLTRSTASVVSMDGAKAGMLEAAYRHHAAKGAIIYNVIGHPKSLTPYALAKLDQFLGRHKELKAATFGQLADLGVIPPARSCHK